MVAPLIIAGAAIAAGALIKYYNSEKSRNAGRQTLRDIEDIFNKIKPPDYDLSIFDDPEMVAKIPDAAFNWHAITPEDYKVVGQYVPEVADFVQETQPELVHATAAAQEGRGAQLDALERLRGISRSDFDPELQQRLQQASTSADRDAKSRVASVVAGARRRGVGGAGAELAGSIAAGANAYEQQSRSSMDAAAEAYRNRLAALRDSATLGGQIRESEMSEEGANVDRVNRFNERFSKRYQDYLTAAADTRNQAQMRNLDARQRVGDANVANHNKYRVDNLERENHLKQQGFENARGQADTIASRKLALSALKNQLAGQRYATDVQKAGLMAGAKGNFYADTINRGQDYNNITQGATDGIVKMTGAGGGGGQQQQQQQRPPDPMPNWNGYDYGGTPGNYRQNDSEVWRTA